MNLMLDAAVVSDTDHAFANYVSRPVARIPSRQEVNSHDLMRGHRELTIVHGDQEYRLRITQNDKLILTK
ncbi:MAG: hemin uptake protein HemP [Lysobacteraceae bacterium]